MKNISENFHFLVVKFSVYLNRHVFVMIDNLHETSYPVFWESKKIKTKLLSAELAQRE